MGRRTLCPNTVPSAGRGRSFIRARKSHPGAMTSQEEGWELTLQSSRDLVVPEIPSLGARPWWFSAAREGNFFQLKNSLKGTPAG